ncbi:MAG: cytochrome C [Flavobacteriales bacterium]|nr:cytochrome C [Flavobacteriales bacterium]
MKRAILFLSLLVVVGLLAAMAGFQVGQAQGPMGGNAPDLHLFQGRPTVNPDYDPNYDFGLGDSYITELMPYPKCDKGDRTPFDIWRYAGKAKSSYTTTELPMSFEDWVKMNIERKPEFMKEVRDYMAGRYDFNARAIPGATMSGGHKPIMAGPISRLSPGVKSWETLAEMSPEEIKKKDVFPYKPLAHPIQSTAHIVFPDNWLQNHPEDRRMDVDHDIPNEYLPEFPPPLFLTTHKEMGDVTKGVEVTISNYFEIFNGLCTPEQMEGLQELLRPSPTTWFNHTTHRITEEASVGVACLSCHVNGHTNGAFELAPDSRPNLARLRMDTPSMRGNYDFMQLSSKRSIRSMDHFAEVEEYFDGDQAMQAQIGPRGIQKSFSNRMGDFNSIIDFPPAPKLDPLSRLIPDKCTPSELRGEKLFQGKAMCSQCHYGPAFTDDYLHDLQVERFYHGRPEGPIKTFALRGIKDSPPYFHDGRLMTLDDTVEFFNLILGLRLTAQEKDDLTAYLLCL